MCALPGASLPVAEAATASLKLYSHRRLYVASSSDASPSSSLHTAAGIGREVVASCNQTRSDGG